MTLRHEPDVSVADWIVRDGIVDDDEAWTRALQGPPGFAAYATVRFDGDEAHAYRPDPDLVREVTLLAGAHTDTPDRCHFALWDGWGEIADGRVYSAMDPDRIFGRVFRRPHPVKVTPVFGREVLSGPRADLAGLRAYLLFTGAAHEVGDWPSRPPRPGWPADLPQASLTWPADHAWCIASDVDPDWFTVGGPRALVDAVLSRSDLQAEPVTHGSPPA